MVQTEVKETPTPSANEQMYKNEAVIGEQKEKTQEEIEKEVTDLFKEGKKYFDTEEYDGAVEIWDRIVQNYPTSKQLYDVRYALATACEFDKKYDQAIINYQKVLAENQNPNSLLNRATALRNATAGLKNGILPSIRIKIL